MKDFCVHVCLLFLQQSFQVENGPLQYLFPFMDRVIFNDSGRKESEHFLSSGFRIQQKGSWSLPRSWTTDDWCLGLIWLFRLKLTHPVQHGKEQQQATNDNSNNNNNNKNKNKNRNMWVNYKPTLVDVLKREYVSKISHVVSNENHSSSLAR